ncbi:MAG TPA: DNA primase small subunit domain-containing protein [Candidatus Sulfotelmatobacter sp.]|nr:DNA primase small subunit domain-containing protein [Candidatus Sulfotelmatobacter sp.]
MVRHKSVANLNGLKQFLSDLEPSDVYYSSAYYNNPEADMNKKGWLGADLVFDIDADHIPTDCDKIHDEWTCSKCSFNGKGIVPESCPVCGGQKFDTKTWPCERCINSTKTETIKLIDILEKDFGFSEREIYVFFSGHRGYHVHIETEAIRTLDSMARKEMVDYITGLGLNLSRKATADSNGKVTSRTFRLLELSRYGRLKEDMRKFVEAATKHDLTAAGVKGGAASTILQYKQQVLERCIGKGMWDSVTGIKDETWFKIVEYLTNLHIAAIDTVVTTDIHRLIRMNRTLHGKSGLLKVEFPVRQLIDFDPFKEAVAFNDGTARVFVSSAPQFRLGDVTFGPYNKQTVILSTAAAILLICKGRAELVKD